MRDRHEIVRMSDRLLGNCRWSLVKKNRFLFFHQRRATSNV